MRAWMLLVAGLLVALGVAPGVGAGVVSANAQASVPAADEAPRGDTADPPDVIVIMTDDQRVGTERAMATVSAFFSRGGVRYPNAQTPTNLCCPARASFLTGRYAHSTGVWENYGPQGGYARFRALEDTTLPVALRGVGYTTALFGKYLNQFNARATPGYVPPGWDGFAVPEPPSEDGGYWARIRGLRPGYTTDVLGEGAARFIAESDPDQPLFLLFAPYAPHAPFTAGPYRGQLSERERLAHMRYGRFRNSAFNEIDVSDKPAWVRSKPMLGVRDTYRMVRRQAETLLGVDANVARILQSQSRHRDLDNTLVVYLSDNGYAWGEHRLLLKHHPYSLANRIPLWVRYPVGTPVATGVSEALVNQLDVTQTIVEMTGADLDTEGMSLVSGQRRTRLLLEAAPTLGPRSAPGFCGFRTLRHLYVHYTTGERELYDLARDPDELVNLIPGSEGARRLGARLTADFPAAGCDLGQIGQMTGTRLDRSGD